MSKIKLTAIPLTVLLSGCFYQTVAPQHYQAAEEYCGSRGGVHSIVSVFQGSMRITCRNGKRISYTAFLDSRYKQEKHNEQN